MNNAITNGQHSINNKYKKGLIDLVNKFNGEKTEDIRLFEAIKMFKKDCSLRSAKSTQGYYDDFCKYISDGLGNIYCDEITRDVITNYLEARRDLNPNISNVTLNKHLAAIKTVVKFATGRKIEFKKLKERKKITPTLSKSKINNIFIHYECNIDNKYAFRNYLYLRILLDTGLRLSEATHLKVNNLILSESAIHVIRTKTDVDRYVIMTEPTTKLMKEFITKYKIKNYIFTDFKNDLPLSTSAVESFIYRLTKKLKLENSITPHKWRHTFATNFTRGKGNMEALRILMGHSNLKTTQQYLHLGKQDLIKEYKEVFPEGFTC